jgi:hypothetical protein
VNLIKDKSESIEAMIEKKLLSMKPQDIASLGVKGGDLC